MENVSERVFHLARDELYALGQPNTLHHAGIFTRDFNNWAKYAAARGIRDVPPVFRTDVYQQLFGKKINEYRKGWGNVPAVKFNTFALPPYEKDYRIHKNHDDMANTVAGYATRLRRDLPFREPYKQPKEIIHYRDDPGMFHSFIHGREDRKLSDIRQAKRDTEGKLDPKYLAQADRPLNPNTLGKRVSRFASWLRGGQEQGPANPRLKPHGKHPFRFNEGGAIGRVANAWTNALRARRFQRKAEKYRKKAMFNRY